MHRAGLDDVILIGGEELRFPCQLPTVTQMTRSSLQARADGFRTRQPGGLEFCEGTLGIVVEAH